MDVELVKLINETPGALTKEGAVVRVIFDQAAIEIERPTGPVQFKLKPLTELYGVGAGDAVDPRTDAFMPLFMGIEEEISLSYRRDPNLTDAAVASTLGTLGMTPEALIDDPLGKGLNVTLRYVLSLNNYSRQEVRQALRKIHKSIDRHSREGGRWGYLTFIADFFANAKSRR